MCQIPILVYQTFVACDLACYVFMLLNRNCTITLYYSMEGLLKPTLVTNSNYLNLVCNKNLNFSGASCLFLPIKMIQFLFVQRKEYKSKMKVFDNLFEILPIFSFWCKILTSRLIFLVEIKRIRLNWCPRLDGLQ